MKVNTEVLTDYLNGKCDEKTKQTLEIWRNEDPKNEKYLIELKTYWDAKESTSTQINFDAEKGYKELLDKKRNRKQHSFKKILRYVAMIAVIITSGLLSYTLFLTDQSIKIVVNIEETEKKIELPDGTTVFLASKSSIEYAKVFSEHERLVHLKGEAFFNVARNEEKPFVILTAETKTRVLGTSFRISEKEKRTNIKVRTGIVEFMDINMPENKIRLVKGEMAQFIKKQDVILKGDTEYNNEHFSIEILEYNKVDLGKVCSDLSEIFSTEIKIQTENNSQLAITAIFENQDLESIIESICFILDLEFVREENYILLK